MSVEITDSCRLHFLEMKYFNHLFYDKSKSLWFLGNLDENQPFSAGISVQDCIDRVIDYNDKSCYIYEKTPVWIEKWDNDNNDCSFYENQVLLRDSELDKTRLQFLNLKLFHSIRYSYLRCQWEIGGIDSISVSSKITLRDTIDGLLGIRHPDYQLN